MADLTALVRYRKRLVEDKQKFLSQLYRDAERVEQTKQIILDQMEHEKRLANEMGPSAHIYLGHYLDGARKKVRALDSSLRKMQERIDAAQEEVRAAFAEMKKIQITQDRREEEEDEKQKKKESAGLDDIAIERFMRDKE